MACVFLFCGAFLLLMSLFHKSDYCQEVSNNESSVIITSSLKSSDMYLYNFANKVILFISIVLMTLGLIPWYIYRVVPTYRNCYVSHDPAESLVSIRIKIDQRMIVVEACNALIYFILLILMVLFLSFGLHKPQNILPADFSHYYFNNKNQIMCIPGFGVYIWIKPLLCLILGSSFIMALISLGNIYRQYLILMRDKNLALSREEFSFDMTELEMIQENQEPESES